MTQDCDILVHVWLSLHALITREQPLLGTFERRPPRHQPLSERITEPSIEERKATKTAAAGGCQQRAKRGRHEDDDEELPAL